MQQSSEHLQEQQHWCQAVMTTEDPDLVPMGLHCTDHCTIIHNPMYDGKYLTAAACNAPCSSRQDGGYLAVYGH